MIENTAKFFIASLLFLISGCILTENSPQEDPYVNSFIKRVLDRVEKNPNDYKITGTDSNDLITISITSTYANKKISLIEKGNDSDANNPTKIQLIADGQLFESYNENLFSLFHSAFNTILGDIKERTDLTKTALLYIKENPEKFKDHQHKIEDKTVLNHNRSTSLSVYWVSNENGKFVTKYRKTPSSQILLTTAPTNKYLNLLFDECRQSIRIRNLVLAQIEERKKRQTAASIANKKLEEDAAKKKLEIQLAKIERFKQIKNACINAGFKGYKGVIIPDVITTTQQYGGLEEFLNWVIDYPTGELYSQIKAISILDNAVLYSYSGPDTHFVIHVEKKPNKIYQENQPLKRNFYVFTGMYSYISTSGAKKSVPSFKIANINIQGL